MYLISAKGCKNAKVDFSTIKTKVTSEIWVNMKDVGSGMGVKNISDLVLKEIYGICETKNPTKEQVITSILKLEKMSQLLLLNAVEEKKQEV